MYAEDGTPLRLVGVSMDITDRVEIEAARDAALADAEALATERAAILGQIADVVVTTDSEGRITFFNDAARLIYGDMRHGLPIWDEAQPFTLLDSDGQRKDVDSLPLHRALGGERVFNEEWRVRRADGSSVIVLGSAVPLRGPAGNFFGAAMTVRDVTQQQLLQRQIEYERARLQEVLMQAPAAITVTEGPDHVIVMQNAIARQMVGGRDLIGKRARDVFPEIDAQGLTALQDEVYRSGVPYVGNEVRVVFDRAGDGSPREGFFNFVYHPLRDAPGVVYGILSHAVEVTDQVRARHDVEEKVDQLRRVSRELERSNQDLDQFAYVASHDLKAPLRGIANLTQWIEEDLGDRLTGESREHMRLLKGRVHRMEALIEGILAYSRAGRVRERAEPVDASALVADVVELLSPPAHVVIDVGPLPTLETQRVALQQVFMNLIGNAIKYNTAAAPRVTVRASTAGDGDQIHFTVADNGPGIAPQYHEKVWQIFQTLASRDQIEGTGIGLSVVRRLVESRGGRAWLESDGGSGTTFHFTWPSRPGSTT